MFFPKRRSNHVGVGTISNNSLNSTIAPRNLGMHINTSAEPTLTLNYGVVRSHSYTVGGVYQNWAGIEPTTKGVRDFTNLTSWVNTHFNAGRKIILDLSGTPAWAVAGGAVGGSAYTPYPKGNMVPDLDSDYTDFVTTAASLYAGKIYAYDGWNEPNLPGYYAGSAATATRLATIQRKYYQAVKAADPTALVLSPSFTSVFSGVDGSGGGVVGLKQFLDASDGAGGFGKDWFDHISYHFYCNDNSLRPTGLERMYRQIEEQLVRVSRTDAEIWATETGMLTPTSFTSLSLDDRKSFLTMHMYTLISLGCPVALWFSYDAAGLGFGTGSDRVALTDLWNSMYNNLVGKTAQQGTITVSNQIQMTTQLKTSSGVYTQTINNMPFT